VDFIIGQCDVVFEYCVPGATCVRGGPPRGRLALGLGVPFLQLNLAGVGAGLSSDELFEVSNCIVWAALDAN